MLLLCNSIIGILVLLRVVLLLHCLAATDCYCCGGHSSIATAAWACSSSGLQWRGWVWCASALVCCACLMLQRMDAATLQ